ncbi:MAG: molybdopterin-dependent oxidoreductase [Capsulimonadales bacterium]|nr:molybdopterin-dependent oxidoreductase [Capsulimonadales bacterium]
MNSGLPPQQHLVAPGKWPLVGEKRPGPGGDSWIVTVENGVRNPLSLDPVALNALPQTERTVDIHCVTRWSKPGVRFGGVLLDEIVRRCQPLPDRAFVSFVARSERHHSTSLTLADALSLGTMVALRAEGEPLAVEHGGPVRIVVPERYFYKSLKWLERIDFLAEDRPGYWEAEAGYHNHADPWKEERYIASDTPPHVLRSALQTRDFSGLNLRGIDARRRDLAGLRGVDARLRDSHFEGAKLNDADFTGANLSNAHFADADLRSALFRGADVEGADFSGADLRGADFTGASLFGATFCEGAANGEFLHAVRTDGTTRFSAVSLESLAIVQRALIETTARIDP